MRTIFINRYGYPDQSATARLLTDLTEGLAAQGLEVAVLCSRQSYTDPSADRPARDSHGGVEVYRLPGTRFGRDKLVGRALDYLSFYWGARRFLARELKPGDTVVCMTDPPMLSGFVGGVIRSRGARLINWMQDIFPEVAERVTGRRLPGWLRQRRDVEVCRAMTNVLIGDSMRQHLPSDAHYTVISNWADTQFMRPIPHSENPFRSRWARPGRPLVMYSGNMGRAHEFSGLIEAVGATPEVDFLFVGGGARRSDLEDALRDLPNVRFEDYQPEEKLPYSLSAADLHLIALEPSIEGLIIPGKLHGICSVGRPVLYLGTPEGEWGTLIREEGIGSAADPYSAPAIRAELASLLQGDLEGMGQRARALAQSRFTSEQAVAAWRGVLEAV